uniref:hypothetical protein n=1 Tax=Gelidibacter sp. TaxID=2018083 RepID=UPI00404B11B3
MKRLIVIFFVVLTLTSCDYFKTKKVYTEDILEEELQAINWNDVDDYPTFSTCDASATNLVKKACFERLLHEFLNVNLSQQNIIVTEDVNDTVVLKIHIDKQGKFSIKEIVSREFTRSQIPQLDSILRSSFDSLPQIYPAIKRSQHVATEFSLPVVVNIK